MHCVVPDLWCQERFVQFLGEPSTWPTTVLAAASRRLINFIPHSTKQGKDCSGAALSKEVLSKGKVAGISAELGVGAT